MRVHQPAVARGVGQWSSAPSRQQRWLSSGDSSGSGGADGGASSIVGEVEWTLGYFGFLAYIFAIITYRFPIAMPAMVLATVGVLLQRERLRFPPLAVCFALYILWGLAGYMQSSYPAVVWEQLNVLAKVWLIALVAVNVLRTRGQIRFFLIFFLGVFATHPARGTIFNYVNGYTEFGRAAWNYIYGNPNDMAALTFLPLAVAAALLGDRNTWVRRGALASVIVLPIVIMLTQSRGAFIGLALFAALVWTGQRRRLRGLALLLVLGAIVITVAPSGMIERMTSLQEKGSEADSSSRQRRQIWRVAGEIIDDNPVTGVGLGTYSLAHGIYANAKQEHEIAQGNRDTHSTYLNVMAETGYPGLALFALVVASALIPAERFRRRIKKSNPVLATQIWYLEAALFAYLVAGVFGSFSKLSFLYLHLALLVVIAQTPVHGQPGVSRLGRRGGRMPQPARAPRGALPSHAAP